MADRTKYSRTRIGPRSLWSWRSAGHVACLAILVVVVGSCMLQVAASDAPVEAVVSTPTPVSVAAPGGNWHDLALMSLDFDPPLKPGEVMRVNRPPALLVAVDNRGNQTEGPVVLQLTITGTDDNDVVSTAKQTVPSLAQGEARVVRFDPATSLPMRSAYTMRVQVQPVPGEVNLADNVKEMRVQITAGAGR